MAVEEFGKHADLFAIDHPKALRHLYCLESVRATLHHFFDQPNPRAGEWARSLVGVASGIANSSGGFFFVWTLIAIGVTGLFSVILLGARAVEPAKAPAPVIARRRLQPWPRSRSRFAHPTKLSALAVAYAG